MNQDLRTVTVLQGFKIRNLYHFSKILLQSAW